MGVDAWLVINKVLVAKVLVAFDKIWWYYQNVVYKDTERGSEMRKVIVGALVMVIVGCSEVNNYVKVYNRGVAAYNNGDYTKAIAMFKLSLEKEREYVPPMIGLARCYLNFAKREMKSNDLSAAIKDLEEALYWINQAIEAGPGNLKAIQTKIDILKVRGKVESAIKTAEWSATVAGPNASTLIMLGETYESIEDYDNAEKSYKQAIAVESENAKPYVKLAQLYEKLGRLEDAFEYYLKAYNIDNYYPGLLMKISKLKVELKKQ